MGMAEVVNPRVFPQADCLGSANRRNPIVVPVELVDDSPALGRREHKFLSRLAGAQRDQQLHERRVRPNRALAGTCLRGTNVKLRLAVAFPGLVDPRCRRLAKQVHVRHSERSGLSKARAGHDEEIREGLVPLPHPFHDEAELGMGKEHGLVLGLFNGWQLHAPAGIA
jgi:hypothetical protein